MFINCPFDEDYEPILQAILFCVVYLGFTPRISTERADAGENRLDKIKELIKSSRYSIHDLSRCQSREVGERFRLNMPLELGIDYGCKEYCGDGREAKKILILEEKRYRYQETISDISGCDIEAHAGDYQNAVRKVRNWLVHEAHANRIGTRRILNAYADFQEWYYERQLAAGFDEEDIKDYPTAELLSAMEEWITTNLPI